jgi:hypothetical protein
LIYLAQYQGTAPISVYMGLLNISKTIWEAYWVTVLLVLGDAVCFTLTSMYGLVAVDNPWAKSFKVGTVSVIVVIPQAAYEYFITFYRWKPSSTEEKLSVYWI